MFYFIIYAISILKWCICRRAFQATDGEQNMVRKMQAKSAAKNWVENLCVESTMQKETLISFASTFYCINVIIHVKNKFVANKNTRLRRVGVRARVPTMLMLICTQRINRMSSTLWNMEKERMMRAERVNFRVYMRFKY